MYRLTILKYSPEYFKFRVQFGAILICEKRIHASIQVKRVDVAGSLAQH